MSKSFLVDALLTKSTNPSKDSQTSRNNVDLWTNQSGMILPHTLCISPHGLCAGPLGISEYLQRGFYSYASNGLSGFQEPSNATSAFRIRGSPTERNFGNLKRLSPIKETWPSRSFSSATEDIGELFLVMYFFPSEIIYFISYLN